MNLLTRYWKLLTVRNIIFTDFLSSGISTVHFKPFGLVRVQIVTGAKYEERRPTRCNN